MKVIIKVSGREYEADESIGLTTIYHDGRSVPGYYLYNYGWIPANQVQIENPTPENPEWGEVSP